MDETHNSAQEEVILKVEILCKDKFFNDMNRMFDFYDLDKDGKVSIEELSNLLYDAGVGGFLTVGIWAKLIISKMDLDKDDKISKEEFKKAIQEKGVLEYR